MLIAFVYLNLCGGLSVLPYLKELMNSHRCNISYSQKTAVVIHPGSEMWVASQKIRGGNPFIYKWIVLHESKRVSNMNDE